MRFRRRDGQICCMQRGGIARPLREPEQGAACQIGSLDYDQHTSGCPSEGCSLSCEGASARDIPGSWNTLAELAASSGASCSKPCIPACTAALDHHLVAPVLHGTCRSMGFKPKACECYIQPPDKTQASLTSLAFQAGTAVIARAAT